MKKRIKIYIVIFYTLALLLLVISFIFGISTIKSIMENTISNKNVFYGLIVIINIIFIFISTISLIWSIIFAYLARKSQKQIKGNRGKGNIIVSYITLTITILSLVYHIITFTNTTDKVNTSVFIIVLLILISLIIILIDYIKQTKKLISWLVYFKWYIIFLTIQLNF